MNAFKAALLFVLELFFPDKSKRHRKPRSTPRQPYPRNQRSEYPAPFDADVNLDDPATTSVSIGPLAETDDQSVVLDETQSTFVETDDSSVQLDDFIESDKPSFDADTYPFVVKSSVLTAAEQSFYVVLLQSVGTAATVLAKVCMRDFIEVPKDTPKQFSHKGRIQQKHVDFLLCKTATLKPILAIELDDRSHNSDKAKKNDEFKNNAYAAAKLPLLRIKASRAYDKKEIRQKIQHAVRG